MQRQLWILGGLSIAVVLVALLLPPVSQPVDYHQFADQRNLLNIPNFNDVASNLAFLLSGGAGLVYLFRIYQTPAQKAFRNRVECLPYWALFLSVVASGLGSMIYHWIPDNANLLWDRLPIATGITALLAATLVDRVSPTGGLWSLPFLIVSGVLSVLYWYWTEQQGAGNLNFYIVVQFYSILLIILLSVYYPSRYTHAHDIYQVIALYAVAKLTEMLDMHIFVLTSNNISGHTLKHLLAALAVYRIVQILQKREFLSEKR
ncbi:alkaline phytoceramidase [Nitrosomonas sp.]|uniref:alkaline phytoceramidase n=1 Tax=Nitrosomonas sp. TaxID=42353 RepID=UPI002636E283|nr:alkaline phytoceramidase [Nitrosomonas sp.]